ncbi:MAG: hypothetical protein ACYTAF_00475 [Planctomycetota bacterium]
MRTGRSVLITALAATITSGSAWVIWKNETDWKIHLRLAPVEKEACEKGDPDLPDRRLHFETRRAEEYLVYSVFLSENHAPDKTIVIQSRSGPVAFRPLGTNPRGIAGSIHFSNPDVGGEMLLDFESRNTKEALLAPRFGVPNRIILVDEHHLRALAARGDFEDEFEAEYHGAEALLTLSRVGFNRERNQAVLYATSDHFGSGREFEVLLHWKNGCWRIRRSSGGHWIE